MLLKDYSDHLKKELGLLFEEKELQNHLAILYQHYLNLDRAAVIINQNRPLSKEEEGKLSVALEQLKRSKPIDYIINESVFFGREFYVDESVLIPRSETEELVLWILEEEQTEHKIVLDIGSGSGCIPITLALEGDFTRVDALEISEDANETAKKNAKNLGAIVTFSCLNILTECPPDKYDIIVSNPPYVKEEELHTLDRNVIEYEPLIALTPKGDPLTFYKRMIDLAPQILKRGGKFYWEIHEDLGQEVLKLLKREEFSEVELRQDIYGRDRLVKAKYL